MAGFTKIDNELLETLALTSLSGSEIRVALLIIRETLGFHRTFVRFSKEEIAKVLNLSVKTVDRSLKNLHKRKIIVLTGSQISIISGQNCLKNRTKLSQNPDKFVSKTGQNCPSYTLYKENKENKEKKERKGAYMHHSDEEVNDDGINQESTTEETSPVEINI